MTFIAKHFLEIVCINCLFLFWVGMIGFITNGLGWTKFDLDFIWKGISTLLGAGTLSSIKYITDSFLNSEKGKGPYETVKDFIGEVVSNGNCNAGKDTPHGEKG